MKKLSSLIKPSFFASTEQEKNEIAKALRAGEVRAIWASLVEKNILDHTNGVYIIHDGKTIMHVYVDESIYAAELNNRRELIQLMCNEKYNEAVEELQIHISYGLMKKRYPFKEDYPRANRRVFHELSESEKECVENVCASIEDQRLRQSFRQAMIADLKWSTPNI